MKPIIILMLLTLTCGIGRAQTYVVGMCPKILPKNSGIVCYRGPDSEPIADGSVEDAINEQNFYTGTICSYIGKESVVKLVHVKISPDIRYCDSASPKDAPCIMRRGEFKAHAKAERDLERIALRSINDLSDCQTRIDNAYKISEGIKKTLQDMKP